MAGKYESIEDARVSEKGDALAQLLGAAMRQSRDIKAQQDLTSQKTALENEQRERDLATAQGLAQQYPERGVHIGHVAIAGQDPLNGLLRMQQLKAMQDERLDKAVQQGSKSLIDSNLPQSVAAFKRMEEVAPGMVSGQAQPKSVGGIKNLIPNLLVTPLEKMGVLPKGAADERAALQELANTKIYDSSGKQINESEMRRIQDAMGMRGAFEPSVLQSALKEMGQSILSKGRTAEAGIRPQAKEILQERGAVSVDPLAQILGAAPKAPAASSGSSDKMDAIMKRIQELEAKRAQSGR